ncbi:MAG: bifunctional DNA-formamidopyrimidine glycosylase/DNA-(apurinic or apyrimidinic site) lyase [Elusimicrobia bacterium]|nr:bifunctional DNA-formamidopyrimidine glycosylase/DNA-(apurinic or apyrimidinic site) lyase [Elusimicrobiota bacterium]
MPELPEVETIKRELEKHLTGEKIKEVRVRDPFILTGISPQGTPRRKISIAEFNKSLLGKTVQHFSRRGKYLIMEFQDQSSLICHLRMTGQLLIGKPKGNERAHFIFDDHMDLCFYDRRRFGEIFFSLDWKLEPCISALGVEPLNGDLTASFLKEKFKGRQASIHSLLLNQKIICGLGNIYAAEALFRASIPPYRKASKISFPKLEKLISSIKEVLNSSILNRGYSMSTYVDALGKKGKNQLFTAVYGKENEPCPSCNHCLKKIKLSGRSVVYCPQCQK